MSIIFISFNFYLFWMIKCYYIFCAEIDECTAGAPCGDVVNTCANSPAGLYTCTCASGYTKINAGTLTETCQGKNC